MRLDTSISNVGICSPVAPDNLTTTSSTSRRNKQLESPMATRIIRQRHSGRKRRNSIFSPDSVNPYHVLQVRQDATPSEIRQSYKRLALFHHPGRSLNVSLEERRRRFQVFEAISFAYETLIDKESKKRFDTLLRRAERDRITAGLPVGELHVGGQTVIEDHAEDTALFQCPYEPLSCGRGQVHDLIDDDSDENDDDLVPNMSPVSSQSTFLYGDSFDELEEEELMDHHTFGVTVDVSDHDEAEIHFSKAENNRQFGGHLSLLYRARRWEEFKDPLDMFNTVFGSRIFRISAKEIGRLQEWTEHRPARNIAWTGSSETLGDGTTIFTTKRSLHDRTITRTESISVNSDTNFARCLVRVSSEDKMDSLVDDDQAQKDDYKWDPAYLTCDIGSLLIGNSQEDGVDCSKNSIYFLCDHLSALHSEKSDEYDLCGLLGLKLNPI